MFQPVIYHEVFFLNCVTKLVDENVLISWDEHGIWELHQRDTCSIVAVTPCTVGIVCGSPSLSRFYSVGVLGVAAHSSAMDAPSWAVLFAYSIYFLSCFLVSRWSFPVSVIFILCLCSFYFLRCLASARSWIMSCSLHSSKILWVVCTVLTEKKNSLASVFAYLCFCISYRKYCF